MPKIAALLTCFNRKNKTVACLKSLLLTVKNYNNITNDKVEVSIFLTDDACTDGTAQAAKEVCQGEDIHIVQGNGNLFWAGGMRTAWNEALKQKQEWDFFLLLNDDTTLHTNALAELMDTHRYCIDRYGCSGIYSGITCAVGHPETITYSGDVFESRAKGKWHRLGPAFEPQMVDQCNANILLVPYEVLNKIGIFHKGYIHGGADLDYCMQVRKAGMPALITAQIIGECEYDHFSEKEECERLIRMTLSERRKYVYHPTHSDKDYLLFVKRNIPHKYLISKILRKVRLYCPRLYYYINKARGLY
jgi:GT2 family glycosyltransferase